MKNGDKSSELAACLFFKRLSLLKTSLAVRGINAIEDATLLDLCKKYSKILYLVHQYFEPVCAINILSK